MTIQTRSYEQLGLDDSILPAGYHDGEPVRFGFGASPLSDAVFAQRDAFVRDMGWRPADERDQCDDDPRTLHYAAVKDNQVAASMRLTPVDSFDQALSVQMLAGDPAAMLAAHEWGMALDERIKLGPVWDLTRVVTPVDGSVSAHAILAGLCEMFGAGYIDTDSDTRDTSWVFTTTRSMKEALEHLGIQHETITVGHLSEKDLENGVESYFCRVAPHEAFARVLENPDSYRFTVRYSSQGMDVARQHRTDL